MHQLVSGGNGLIYKAIVVGAGPSGLACVGNILDRLKEAGEVDGDRVLWIDPLFQAGRLNVYPEVPSNTKVCLFTQFATECKSFCDDKSEEGVFLKKLSELDPQKGCKLKLAAGLCKELTDHLRSTSPILKCHKSLVKELNYSMEKGHWRVISEDGVVFTSEKVFLTTGSQPRSLQTINDDNVIDLDDALNPEILSSKISSKDQVIALYGSSHSAMLVLMNLLSVMDYTGVILNYYRQPAKFASFPDPIGHPDQILHDNTGLKGEVAQWVKKWIGLEGTAFDEFFTGRLKRIKTTTTCNNFDDNTPLTSPNKVIYAVGYQRNPLPKIIHSNTELSHNSLDYNSSGQLSSSPGRLIDGLYGFGIAFPERVKDLDGADELAVGLWKFMKYIKKSIYAMKF